MTWITARIATLLGWVSWGRCLGFVIAVALLGGCVSAIRMMPPLPVVWGETPTATVTKTTEPTPEPTAEPTATVVKQVAKVKEVVVVVTATSQPQQPTAEPTALPTGVAIQEGVPNSCGYTLPNDWLESADYMTTQGQTRVFPMDVPAGQVAFIWGTTVKVGGTNLTRGLVLIKGPFIGDVIVTDGAGRVGQFNHMGDEGLARAMAHIESWLKCSYGESGWQTPLWVPANQ